MRDSEGNTDYTKDSEIHIIPPDFNTGFSSTDKPCLEWVEVIISCKPGWEDPISAMVFDSGFSGLEEKTEGNCPLIKAYGKKDADVEDIVSKLRKALELLPSESDANIISINDIPFEDWEYSWRRGLEAVEIGAGIVVKPSWIEYENIQNRLEILIDPKMAFGTGSHASTYLCLELIEKMTLHGMKVMDAGCGSGILGITAAKLGASEVYCFDNDPFSVENAIENAKINGVGKIVAVEEKNLENVNRKGFDIVFANIISHILISNLTKFYGFLKPGGIIVFSGLLADEEKDFTKELERAGFKNVEFSYREEWMAAKAVRPVLKFSH